MTGYQLNKIAGAVLAALLLFFGTRQLIEIFWTDHPPEEPGYDVAVTDEASKATGEGGEQKAGSIATLLASADAGAGKRVANKCAACHSFEEGGGAVIGPNLHGVVGRDIASKEGFQYTAALSGLEGDWTYEKLSAFLEGPMEYAPGTSMAFPGVKEPEDRADLILYLRSITPDAPPLPEPGAAPAAPEVAEGEAAEKEEQTAAEEQVAAQQEAAPQPENENGASAPEGEQAAPPTEGAAPEGEAAAEAEPASLGDPAAGEKAIAICKACHSFEAGQPAPIGPNLHGVYGRDIASVGGFEYSPALQKKEGDWTAENLSAFIAAPMKFAPGTKMFFAGVKSEKQRQDIIAYLKSLSQ